MFVAGAGHGSYALAKVLFPFAMLAAVIGHSIGLISILLACVQFPIYGLVIGNRFRTSSFRESAIWIVLIHFAVATVVFACGDVDFS
jgi:hypothetical protein